MNDQLFGLEAIISDSLWEFPNRRFVQFEYSDEVWARKLGFGRVVPMPENDYIIKPPRIFLRRSLFEKLKYREQAAPEYVTTWIGGTLRTVFHVDKMRVLK